jgi:hypothetical protein
VLISDPSTVGPPLYRVAAIAVSTSSGQRIRCSMNSGISAARPHSTDASVNTMIATANTRLVPKRSAIQPLTGMPTARLRI